MYSLVTKLDLCFFLEMALSTKLDGCSRCFICNFFIPLGRLFNGKFMFITSTAISPFNHLMTRSHCSLLLDFEVSSMIALTFMYFLILIAINIFDISYCYIVLYRMYL